MVVCTTVVELGIMGNMTKCTAATTAHVPRSRATRSRSDRRRHRNMVRQVADAIRRSFAKMVPEARGPFIDPAQPHSSLSVVRT